MFRKVIPDYAHRSWHPSCKVSRLGGEGNLVVICKSGEGSRLKIWGRVRQGESYLTGVSVDNLS